MGVIKFSDITEAYELAAFLKEPQRINSIKFLSKYMKLSSAIRFFSSGMMLINNPANMNDYYEYESFPEREAWSRICFASFISQQSESMAMWSMYAQHWDEGVMISFPANALRELVQNTPTLITAVINEETGRYEPSSDEISAEGILSINRVAYLDGHTLTYRGRDDRNIHFKNPYEHPELAGFIKDSAWEYEKEIRLRVDLPSSYDVDAVFLKLPDSFLKQINITTGPRFAGNAITALPKKFRPFVKIKTSKFTEKLAWTPCDDCYYKNAVLQQDIDG